LRGGRGVKNDPELDAFYGSIRRIALLEEEEEEEKKETVATETKDSELMESDPPLNDKTKMIIARLILEELQHRTPWEKVWGAVYDKLDSSITRGRSVEQLIEAYDDYDIAGTFDLYQPVAPESWANERVRRTALGLGGEARVQIYWRALGRFPGGNADIHTVCYTFDCAKLTVSCCDYANWDGTPSCCVFRPKHLSTALAARLPPLQEALKNAPQDSECTCVDNDSIDSEKYDTEWSSQEIVVLLPRRWSQHTHAHFDAPIKTQVFTFLLVNQRSGGGTPKLNRNTLQLVFEYALPCDYIPAQRLHRRCVMGPQQHRRGARELPPAPEIQIQPTASQLCVLEAAEVVVGMGRVNEWSDAGDGATACAARDDPRVDEMSSRCDYRLDIPSIQPFYFS
jgi:hypothetical protein